MPLYYFSLENGTKIVPDEGEDFKDDAAAIHAGNVVAKEMAQGRDPEDFRILVKNEAGALIHEAKLSDLKVY